MTGRRPKDVSASVHARLLNIARASAQDFQVLAHRYAVERFLARLVDSPHHHRFILKGAMLYTVWGLDQQRSTMDLDLLGLGHPDLSGLEESIKEICDCEMEPDGLRYDTAAVRAIPIRENSVYDGVRMVVRVHLGHMPIRLQIDIGYGDAVTPKPDLKSFPALLSDSGPSILAYTPETVIAEKFNVMVQLGIANSRMKDYFDVWMIGRSFPLEHDTLMAAIRNTFGRRNTPLPTVEPIGLGEEFTRNENKLRQWQGFVRRQGRTDTSPSLHEVVNRNRFLLSPTWNKVTKTSAARTTWLPDTGWVSDRHEDS